MLIVYSYHVMYAFQSESTLYSCLNVKELPAQNKRKIWCLSDHNRTGTHNHLVGKQTLNRLSKLASLVVSSCRHCFRGWLKMNLKVYVVINCLNKMLKETQTFKAYWIVSYKYCIIITGTNTKISKTDRLLNTFFLSLCPSLYLLWLALPWPSSTAEFFQFSGKVLHKI